jgi:hypothetical protein
MPGVNGKFKVSLGMVAVVSIAGLVLSVFGFLG